MLEPKDTIVTIWIRRLNKINKIQCSSKTQNEQNQQNNYKRNYWCNQNFFKAKTFSKPKLTLYFLSSRWAKTKILIWTTSI